MDQVDIPAAVYSPDLALTKMGIYMECLWYR